MRITSTQRVQDNDEAIQAYITTMEDAGWALAAMVPTSWFRQELGNGAVQKHVDGFWITFEREG